MVYQQTAPAKINLGLHVLRRRTDGYHDVETVLLPIEWTDRITVRPADRLTMSCSDPELPTDERNLCIQAAQLLASTTDTTAGAAIHLEKNIPYGAGLGGGSSDAALVLRLLVKLWNISCTDEELFTLARQLGADVPFFLIQRPAYADGRGDRVVPLDGSYSFPYTLVVVAPPITVSTAEAYQHVQPRAEGRPDLRALVRSNDLSCWQERLVNDFEATVPDRYPVIRTVKERILAAGAGYAALSGSGSAVFGVFEDPAIAHEAVRQFARQDGYGVWQGRAL